MITILFLAANPTDTARLGLDAESRAIDEALRKAGFRDQFDLKLHFAVRAGDLQELFLRHRPQVVHFSGHGSPSSEIILEDANGASRSVPPRALETLFELFGADVRCVVLNACFTAGQAQAIARHIPAVVGMSTRIGDQAASAFAAAFYQALAYGESIGRAYKLGCAQIALFDLHEEDTPVLISRDSEAASLVLTKPETSPTAAAPETAGNAIPGPSFQTTVQGGGSIGQVVNIGEAHGSLTIQGGR